MKSWGHVGARRRPRRVVRTALLGLVGTMLPIIAAPAPVGAALSSQGPIDPALGVPSFFADASGVRLAPCVAGTPQCSATAASFNNTSGAPGTGTLAYFSAVGALTTQPAPGVTAVPSSVSVALQATKTGPTVLQRVQIQIQVPQTGVYTVTWPYGTQQFDVTALAPTGFDISSTADSTALGGPIGPYLQWAGAPAPPAGFLGDNATPHAVVGSPSNRNFVRVQGPGINPNPADPASCPAAIAGTDCVQTNLFIVQGQLAPSLTASPAPVVFASQAVGTTSAPLSVTVTNNGTRPFTVNAASAAGPYAVDAASDTCTGSAIGPGSTCAIGVTFSPATTGVTPGTLTIDSDDPGSPLTVPLTGSTPSPAVTLSPTSVTFANQPSGTTSGVQTITVNNSGAAPLHVSAVSLTGTNPGDFNQTNNCVGATVAPASSCTISARFAPTANGLRSAAVSLTDDAPGSPHSVAVSGTGTPPAPAVGLAPTNLTFPNQTTGTASAPQIVTVTNTGNAPLTVSAVTIAGANAAEFTQTSTCPGAAVAPGATCTASLTFSPAALGARAASVSFTDDAAGSPHSATLTGTGIAPGPAVTLSAVTLTFPDQITASSGTPQTVTVTNSGTAPLTFSTVTLGGANAGDFAQTNTCAGASVAPGATCSASVTFTPTVVGARSGGLSFADNAAGSPHVVSLSGNGVSPPPPPPPPGPGAPPPPPDGSPFAVARARSANGYWLVASDGGIFAFGDAPFLGSTGAIHLNKPIVSMTSTPSGNGYWLVASDGGIFAFGDAPFLGSTGAIHLNKPIVSMTSTPSGNGYWLAASDGGIFAFGDAPFLGSTGAVKLNRPIVTMTSTPSGNGYWLVASDGGIFAFGDGVFAGSTGGLTLNRPIVTMASTPSGQGYWLVARDGGIFAFGDAPFLGSTGAIHLNQSIVTMTSTPSGNGYWLVARDGGIFAFGDAPFLGSTGAIHLNQPIVGMTR